MCLGLVGQLQKEESDLGWADLFLIPDRMKYIDYTAPYIVEYASFMLGSEQLYRELKLHQCDNFNKRSIEKKKTINECESHI